MEWSEGAGGSQGSPPLACPSRYSVGNVAGLDANFVLATMANLTRNRYLMLIDSTWRRSTVSFRNPSSLQLWSFDSTFR